MSSYDKIERREAQRTCFCRGCDKEMSRGEEIIFTYSMRNRGQSIMFCLDCAKIIGDLANIEDDVVLINTVTDTDCSCSKSLNITCDQH